MNVEQLSNSELEIVAQQLADELTNEIKIYTRNKERRAHLQNMLYAIQIERQERRDDPWSREDTSVELTETDLAIAYYYAEV